jgi:hypothetical protein
VGNCITYVVNEDIEEQGLQDKSLRNTGENFTPGYSRNTDSRFSVGAVTAKQVCIATRELKCTKLMKKQRMWAKAKCIVKLVELLLSLLVPLVHMLPLCLSESFYLPASANVDKLIPEKGMFLR